MKKIIITENHLKILKHFNWNYAYGFVIGGLNYIEDADEDRQTDYERHESINLILNGRPEDFDPINTTELLEFTSEQISEWDKLYSEIPLVLDVCLNRGKFEVGTFKTRLTNRNWEKID